MNFNEAKKQIAQGRISPIYIGFGTETYFMQEFIDVLIKKLLPDEHVDFALSKYDLQETSLDIVLDDAETLPFMVEKKIIVAENALFFTGAKDKAEHSTDRLQQYMSDPSEHTILVLLVQGDKLDERKKITKMLKAMNGIIDFMPFSAQDLNQWVRDQAQILGLSFTSEALEQFILYTGGNLRSISAELEKLSLYAGSGKTVDVELVNEMVPRSTEQNVFLLIDHIVQTHAHEAFSILYDLLKQKEEPIKIMMLMARQFRIMLQSQELARQGYSSQQIASKLGIAPFVVQKVSSQSRHYTVSELATILTKLAELDYGIKSGKIDKVFGLEILLLQMANAQKSKQKKS